jgi:hypothetical protein
MFAENHLHDHYYASRPQTALSLSEFIDYFKNHASHFGGPPPELASSSLYVDVDPDRQPEAFNYTVIYNTLTANFPVQVADSIIEHLRRHEYWCSREFPELHPISNAHCFVLPSNTLHYYMWAGMLWNEGDMEVLQIYYIDETGFCNYLTHYGKGKYRTANGMRYAHSAIGWQVCDFENLTHLCVAAQHLTWTSLVRPQSQARVDRKTRAGSLEE